MKSLDPDSNDEVTEIMKSALASKLPGKKFLITGGAGFLGSWICDVLISAGARVDCIDNLASGLAENIDHLKGHSSFRFIRSDITRQKPNGEEYDMILHLASRASPEEYQLHPIETLLANSAGTGVVLELAKRSGAGLLFASTSEIYGDPDLFPTPESYWGWVNPVGVRSCYDEGKRFGEALCMAYAREHKIDVRIVRIFNTYGPRMRADGPYGRVIPRFIKQAMTSSPISVFGDGSQTRSFCYFTDTVTGLLRVAMSASAKGEIFNIGSSQELSVLDLARKIAFEFGKEADIVYEPLPLDDPKRRLPDLTKAKKLLGWESRVDLDSGLRKTIKWFTSKESFSDPASCELNRDDNMNGQRTSA